MDAHEKDLNIQWYPGHMTKTRRMIAEQLRHMDAVCEILDARAPLSSRNPDVGELTAGKPRLIVLNRVDLADPAATKAWGAWFRGQDAAVLECNARQGQGTRQFPAAVRGLLGAGGCLICSGIIDERGDEVRAALEDSGFSIEEAGQSEGWFSFVCR